MEGKKHVLADLGSGNIPQNSDEDSVLMVLNTGYNYQLNIYESKRVVTPIFFLQSTLKMEAVCSRERHKSTNEPNIPTPPEQSLC